MDKKLSAQKFANKIANTSSSTPTKKDTEQAPPNTDSSDSDEESVSEVILAIPKNEVFKSRLLYGHIENSKKKEMVRV